MYDPPGRDAAIVRQALSANIDVKAATEVICSRTPSQIQHFKQLYYARFGAYLEHDIEYQTSGDHKKVTRFRFDEPLLYPSIYVFVHPCFSSSEFDSEVCFHPCLFLLVVVVGICKCNTIRRSRNRQNNGRA